MSVYVFLQTTYEYVINVAQFYGLPGYFIAMILQSILAPIPSEALLMLGGASFGVLMGGIVGSLGETAGAVFAFYISRKGGRPVVKRLLGERVMNFADNWFNVYGGRAVFIGRLVPVIPFDAVSYGAGLTKIRFTVFILATFIASFPRAFFYAVLGSFVASEVARSGFIIAFNKSFIIITGLAVTLLVLQNLIMKKFRKNGTGFLKTIINRLKRRA